MTTPISRRGFIGTAAGCAAPAVFGQAFGTGSPVGLMIVPFSTGSLADVLARKYALLLGESSGTTYAVENVTGASGVLAGRLLLKRPADGRTLLWGYSGLLCTVPLLAKGTLDFDPVTDFAPVCILSNTPFLLFAGKDFAVGNLADLRRLAASQKEPLTYVAQDVGSANHIAGEALFQQLGVRATHIPYRNTQQSFIDVAEGRVQLGIFGWTFLAPLLKTGIAKVLAVLSDKPLSVEPQLPTVASQGFGRFDIQGWFGVFAAKGTAPAKLAEFEKLTVEILQEKNYARFLVDAGHEVAFRGRADAAVFIREEVERYRVLLSRLKLI